MTRRLSDQQRKRIQQRQESLRQQPGGGTQRLGRVIMAFGAEAVVEDGDGGLWRCRVRRTAGRPVCGDRVLWEADTPDHGVIVACEPRRTVLSRREAGRSKPLAANLDRVLIVLATRPAWHEAQLDRLLAAAALHDLDALIVLNKVDLLDQPEYAQQDQRLAPYAAMGYSVLFTSARNGEGLDTLRHALEQGTQLLIGASGVGKSSLVQRLLPERELRIGAVCELTGRGRHTTTSATLYRLPDGGELIDAPGFDDLALPSTDPARLAQAFVDFRPFLGTCKFNDCRHRAEPGCAIRDAVARGALSAARLASYHALCGPEKQS